MTHSTATTRRAVIAHSELDLSLVVVQLMKGVVYRDSHERAWRHLVQLQTQARDYFDVMGLTVVVDEAEGYAFLRSRPDDEADDTVPRLVARRTLSFPVSLLLALLRNKLAEFDASDSDTRLVLTREQILETVRLFVPDSSNDVVENEMTYLAFPPVDDAVVVLGGGYGVSRLAELPWLSDMELHYWGDLDTHGFAILDQLRHAWPHTRSLLMDRRTLLAHEAQWVREPKPVNALLDRLAADETASTATWSRARWAPPCGSSRSASASAGSRTP